MIVRNRKHNFLLRYKNKKLLSHLHKRKRKAYTAIKQLINVKIVLYINIIIINLVKKKKGNLIIYQNMINYSNLERSARHSISIIIHQEHVYIVFRTSTSLYYLILFSLSLITINYIRVARAHFHRSKNIKKILA